MRFLIGVFIFFSIFFAQNLPKQHRAVQDKNVTIYKITKKMEEFKKEKLQNEKEAKKLEEDGFCPCSIQQP